MPVFSAVARCLLSPALAGALLLSAAGCTRLPVSGILPPGEGVVPLAEVSSGSPLACAATGDRIAFARGGIVLAEGDRGERQLTVGEEPTGLAWSQGGSLLAAAFPRDDGTVLRIYAGDGAVLGETSIAGRAAMLAWRGDTEVLIAAIAESRLSFGGNLRQLLYRWDGTGTPVPVVLQDVTLMPRTVARWGEKFPTLFRFAMSPGGDAVAYTRFRDPPLFEPSMQLSVRQLESGTDLAVAEFPIMSAGVAFTAEGEGVLYGDGTAISRIYDPWGEQQLGSYALPGLTVAVSPGGESLLIDGRLYRQGKEVIRFPAASTGCFTAKGEVLVIRQGDDLFRLAGLPSEQRPVVASSERERRLMFRKWRSEGLITTDEYRRERERNKTP